MRLLLILCLIVVLLPACSEDAAAPEKPECDLSINQLYFGQILRPVVENETEIVSRTINLISVVQVRSNAGNEDILAHAELIPNDTGSDAVTARIVETDLVDGFSVPPDGVVTLTVELTLRVDSRIGRHEGTVLFGNACGQATYAIDVIGWDEAPPLLETFWGGEGDRDGEFNLPSSIAINSKGEIFVVDRGNDRVQKFDAEGRHLDTWKGYHVEGKFFIPTGIGIDSQDNVFVTDTGGGGARVQMFDEEGTWIKQWSGIRGFPFFANPWEIAIDKNDVIYVLDRDNGEVLVFIVTDTGYGFELIDRWGVQGTDPGQLDLPSGLAISPDDFIYITDSRKHRISKFTKDGEFVKAWGGQGDFPGLFDNPSAVCVDADGNIFVTDDENTRVQKFDQDGTFLNQWGKPGWREGSFFHPWGVTVDAAGAIYVVDSGHHWVQKFVPAPEEE